MDGIRAGKYAFRGASLLVEAIIILVIAGPMLGAITPGVSPQSELGLGLDLGSINSQLAFMSSSSTIAGPHTLTFPAFNKWLFPARLSLQLDLSLNGSVIYHTQTANATLAPFQSGTVSLTVDIPQSAITQMEGQRIAGGGEMTMSEVGFWSITVNLAQG